MTNQPTQNLVFIVGVGRSGTSLLQSMLHTHPDVSFAPEFNFIRRFLATGELERLWARDKELVVAGLASDELVLRLGLSEERLREILFSMDDEFSSRELYLLLLKARVEWEKGNVRWFGDKDPRSVEYLSVLHHHFPQARVLHIIRDPRDVLASKKEAKWSRNRSPLGHVFANRVQLKMGRRQGRDLFGSAYLEVFYEDLISDPEAVLTRICGFLNIAYNPTMLEFSGSSKIFVTEEEMQWKKETLGPLLVQNAGKWKTALSPWEAVLTERVCREAFDTMHYRRSAGTLKLNLLQRLALGPVTMLLAGIDPLYQFYRNR